MSCSKDAGQQKDFYGKSAAFLALRVMAIMQVYKQNNLISDLPQIRNTFNGSGLVVASARSSLGSMAGRSKRRLKR